MSMGYSRQEYWSGLPFPSPGDLPNPGTEPVSLISPALADGFFTTRHHPGSPILSLDLGFTTNHTCTLEYDQTSLMLGDSADVHVAETQTT